MQGIHVRSTVLAVGLVLALLVGLSWGPGSAAIVAQGNEAEASVPQQALPSAPSGTALGSAFSYQGRLVKDGRPVDGTCDLQFKLWDALSGGAQQGSVLTRTGVTVQDGLFTVGDLDFVGAFSGEARWLEVAVKCSGDASYVALSPRQALTAAPAATSLVVPFRAQGSTLSAVPLGSWKNTGAGDALSVESASRYGLYVASAGSDGVFVDYAAGDGVSVDYVLDDGVYVHSAADDGGYVAYAGGDGLQVDYAAQNGVNVAEAVYNGVFVDEAGNSGLNVNHAVNYGVYIWSANQDGVRVSSASNQGVHANTSNSSHQWGFYTPDAAYAQHGWASAAASLLVAQNGDGAPLEAGDVVVLSGAGVPFAGSDIPAPLVRRAGAGSGAIVGVVYGPFGAEERVEEVESKGQVERRTSLEGRSIEGPITPGDYLLLVVLGPAQVKAGALAGGIRPGDLLAAGSDGQAALLAAGAYVPGTVIGMAMEALDAAQAGGLLWVFVQPR